MDDVRAVARLVALAGWTFPLYAGYLLTLPAGWISARAGARLYRFFVGTWARGVLAILGVRARYEGEPPPSPFFLVSNHLSYVDIPVLLGHLDARFLAKSEVASWPLLGLLARTTGTLFIDRARKRDLNQAIAGLRRVVSGGAGVVVFPEATSTRGAEVLPFKPSVFQVPAEMGIPVSCAAISYECPDGRPAWEAVCWWGDAPFAPHFYKFLKLSRTEATVTFSPRIPPGLGRKELAAAAHGALCQVFRHTCPPESRATPSTPL